MESESKKGFAALTPEQRKEIAAKGGKAAVNRHKFTTETGRAASLKRTQQVDNETQNG